MVSNAARVVLAVERSAGVTRAELADRLGLPRATVAGVVAELVRAGRIVGLPDSGRRARPGRPTTLLVPAGPSRLVGALIVTSVGVRAAVADYGAAVLASVSAPVDARGAPASVVPLGAELLRAALAEMGRDLTALDCVAVGVPAPFETGVGAPTFRLSRGRSSPEFDPWLSTDPADQVRDLLGCPVLVENDANLGAVGESAFGAGRAYRHAIYLKISALGFGAGLILDNRLYRGASGFAGEVAHLHVDDDGPLCVCGGRGCLGSALGRSLVALVQPAYAEPLEFADVLTLAERGDPGPRRILYDAGQVLGRSLAAFCTLLNPEAIVLDTGLGPATAHVARGIREAVDRDAAPVAAERIEVVAGELTDAEVAGAVALARVR
jgi:predicted NBD/HSP70 family sugar kinase